MKETYRYYKNNQKSAIIKAIKFYLKMFWG